MRKTLILLCAVGAALCAPAEVAPESAEPPPPAAPAPPAPHPDAAERQDTVNKLEPLESEAPTDDLKPDASFWGGYGWGSRPRYYGYYRPRYYSAPYWGGGGGYGWRGGVGWGGGGGGWGGGWGGGYWG